MLIRSVFLGLFVLIVSTSVAASCEDKEVECGPITEWHDATRLDMSLRDDQGQEGAHWIISQDHERMDFTIESEVEGGFNGTLMVISGRAVLVKGEGLDEGYELDFTEFVGQMMKLLLNVLGHVAPDGPQSISGDFPVNHTEKEKPIKVVTQYATGIFGAPWSATGMLTKRQDNVVDYDIDFESRLEDGSSYAVEMAGTWEQRPPGPAIDSMPLEGWKLYTLESYTTTRGKTTFYNYGPRPIDSRATSLGEFRREVEAARAEKESDAPRDPAQ